MGLMDMFSNRPPRNPQYDALESVNKLNVDEEMASAGIRNFVISASISGTKDCLRVGRELERGNILILDYRELGRSPEVDDIIAELRSVLTQKGGEMARISDTRNLVVPGHYKIVKKKL